MGNDNLVACDGTTSPGCSMNRVPPPTDAGSDEAACEREWGPDSSDDDERYRYWSKSSPGRRLESVLLFAE